MLINRYPAEDVFARVPEVAAQTDPVLKQLDVLLDDDELYQQMRADLGKRYRGTLVHGRHSTPVEVLLRMLLCKHLYHWSYRETEERVKDSLVLRWFCRVYFERVPDETTLIRSTHTLRPETLHALNDRVVELAQKAKVTKGRKLRLDATCVQTTIHHPDFQWTIGRQCTGALALRAAGQMVAQGASEKRQTDLPLAFADGSLGGPDPASAGA